MMSRFAWACMRSGRNESGSKSFRFHQIFASYAPVPSESIRVGLTFPGRSRTVPAITEVYLGNKKVLETEDLFIISNIFAARPHGQKGLSGSVGKVHPSAD